MKKSLLVIVVTVLNLSGCVSSHQPVAPNIKQIKLPETGIVSTSSLGERMLESGKVTTVDGFTLYNDVSIFDGVVKSGTYHQIGVKANHQVFGPDHGFGTGVVGALGGTPSPAKPYVDGNTGYLCFWGVLAHNSVQIL